MGNEALWTQSLEERDTRLRPFFLFPSPSAEGAERIMIVSGFRERSHVFSR